MDTTLTNYSRLLIFLLLLTQAPSSCAYASKIYTWHDKHGVLVFSDSPQPGAEEVEVKVPKTITFSVDTSILDINPQVVTETYKVNISQPEANKTIRDNTGSVYVSGQVQPIFKRGFTVQLYLDNKPYKKPQTHTMFVLRNIDRGEHQIKMILLGDKGKVIATSSPITFYMHRISVNRAN